MTDIIAIIEFQISVDYNLFKDVPSFLDVMMVCF